jgi:O-antigen biosynthesis protein WbqP
MKRGFDILFSVVLGVILLPVAFCVAIAIWMSDPGPVIFWSKRVGQMNALFNMPKFRTMKIDTPQLPTHKMVNPEQWIISIGSFLRSTSLDEIPQLWSIFLGKMSVVGPRPALFNQDDLVKLRTEHAVEKLRPGLTGWAQINGRDNLSIFEKVEFDAYYVKHQSFLFDLKILVRTFLYVLSNRDVAH